MCAAAGDKTRCHHAARNQVGRMCSAAGLSPELEKPNMLPPDPHVPGNNLRRPADVYLPNWRGGAPAALDLAVASPQRQDAPLLVASRPDGAVRAYEEHKRTHLNTALECERQGVTFVPVVAEPTGGWGPSGMSALIRLAHLAAPKLGLTAGEALQQSLQQLCTVIRRAKAKAILRREGDAWEELPRHHTAARETLALPLDEVMDSSSARMLLR